MEQKIKSTRSKAASAVRIKAALLKCLKGLFKAPSVNAISQEGSSAIQRLGCLSALAVIVFFLSLAIKWSGSISLLQASVGIGAFLATLWAIQSYWRLVERDGIASLEQKAYYMGVKKSVVDPFTFHELAQSHKEWAQLWFTWCIAIFMGGLTYAFLSAEDPLAERVQIYYESMHWPFAFYSIVSKQMHHAIVYLLFGASWYWAARHYRSHWHNFVINAYRHRALYRIQELQKAIQEQLDKPRGITDIDFPESKAVETQLELSRLSAILLLLPGDSSYLDEARSSEVSKVLLEMEEVSKAFARPKE